MENLKTAAVFKQMAKWQVLATAVVALIAYYFAGLAGALSAVAGGGSAVAGGFAGSCIAKRSEHNKEAGALLVGLLKAEAVKILVVILLLWLTFKTFAGSIVPMALISGLAAAALLSGAAIFALNEKSDK